MVKKMINKPNLSPAQSGGGAKQKRSGKKLVLTIFIVLFLSIIISIASAVLLNTLFGGESSKLLTFPQAGNQTDYIKLPESANVTSSKFNLQGLIYEVASLFQTLTQSDFDEGVYNDTLYNTTNNAVQLNLSYDSGNYTSEVLDTGGNSSYQNLTWHEQRIECPEGMAYINKLNGYCIDQYEAHALNSNGSIATPPTSAGATYNLIAAGGKAGSAFNQTVWVYIDQTEARTACSNAGKHLCTDAEWLGAANLNGQVYNLPIDLAVSPYFCVTGTSTDCAGESPGSGSACKTGGCTDDEGCGNCVSSEGVYDQVGNVWEWTNETATTVSPESGWHYINTTDMTWALVSSADDGTYGKDGTYFLAGTNNRAVLRGGFWNYGPIAGPFCAHLSIGPTVTYNSIGFRCCSS
jgi:hypothetical protein